MFTKVWADIASAACPSRSGSRAMTSITSAAVIRDADERCSINTAWAPGVVFHNIASKHNTTLCTSGIVPPTPHSSDDRRPSTMQSALCCCCFVPP